MVAPAYILRSPHTLASPASRAKLAHALRRSGRGVQVLNFHGLGASPTQPVTDQQYDASADSPGNMTYVRVDIVQCALNAAEGRARLTVDGKWGPQTAAALGDFITSFRTYVMRPPETAGDYVYLHPPAGASVLSMTNALAETLTAGIDTTRCVANAALRTPSSSASPAAHATTTTHTAAPAPGASTDWTMWGIAAAGVVAVGAVGYAVMKRRGRRKKGR